MRPGGTARRAREARAEKRCNCSAGVASCCPYIVRGNNCRGVDHPEVKPILDALSRRDGKAWDYSDFMDVWDTELKKARIAYVSAKARCTNSNMECWPNYGGRGIEFRFTCLAEFLADIGLPPSLEHSIDRKNNDGHYEPGNVRWSTAKEQASNRRRKTV
jgi:hypothetical protein